MLGLKLPVPLVVHLPVEEDPPITPFMASVGLLAQTDILVAAILDVGTGVIDTVIISFTAAQIPFAVEVKVNVVVPALISEALGI